VGLLIPDGGELEEDPRRPHEEEGRRRIGPEAPESEDGGRDDESRPGSEIGEDPGRIEEEGKGEILPVGPAAHSLVDLPPEDVGDLGPGVVDRQPPGGDQGDPEDDPYGMEDPQKVPPPSGDDDEENDRDQEEGDADDPFRHEAEADSPPGEEHPGPPPPGRIAGILEHPPEAEEGERGEEREDAIGLGQTGEAVEDGRRGEHDRRKKGEATAPHGSTHRVDDEDRRAPSGHRVEPARELVDIAGYLIAGQAEPVGEGRLREAGLAEEIRDEEVPFSSSISLATSRTRTSCTRRTGE